jgi:hypothetical protein
VIRGVIFDFNGAPADSALVVELKAAEKLLATTALGI